VRGNTSKREPGQRHWKRGLLGCGQRRTEGDKSGDPRERKRISLVISNTMVGKKTQPTGGNLKEKLAIEKIRKKVWGVAQTGI